eukprot:gnl/TRDRNA2_/TRDRNA2_165998_c0_seq4.p1 gnl/TRDRNA2_/TRDRNA2_165998_c0~~gnl/TRDRNA2_/TRDRNA2_165998_c0_seq4.p1  ORF type:complete len:233 (-),score=18.38 gnl/TRDRNA2_/TRDRNA2_165998_c0_seq4:80-778(-)
MQQSTANLQGFAVEPGPALHPHMLVKVVVISRSDRLEMLKFLLAVVLLPGAVVVDADSHQGDGSCLEYLKAYNENPAQASNGFACSTAREAICQKTCLDEITGLGDACTGASVLPEERVTKMKMFGEMCSDPCGAAFLRMGPRCMRKLTELEDSCKTWDLDDSCKKRACDVKFQCPDTGPPPILADAGYGTSIKGYADFLAIEASCPCDVASSGWRMRASGFLVTFLLASSA